MRDRQQLTISALDREFTTIRVAVLDKFVPDETTALRDRLRIVDIETATDQQIRELCYGLFDLEVRHLDAEAFLHGVAAARCNRNREVGGLAQDYYRITPTLCQWIEAGWQSIRSKTVA